MTGWTIRDGTADDAEAVAAIINHEIRTGLAIWRYAERTLDDVRSMICERIASGMAVLVAEDATGVLGWASYGPFRAGEGYHLTVEHSVHIVPAAQRRGIASALMTELIAHAEGRGLHTIIGGIDDTNAASIALHARLGFVEVGRIPQVGRKFDRWLTLVLMQKTLG